jgi:hypothetical protein
MVNWVESNNELVRDAFDRGGKNCKMTFGNIQKDLAMCCAHEVTKVIKEEPGDRQFSVLIDESCDISVKEKMVAMLRLVVVFLKFYYLLFSMPPYNHVEFVF